MIESPLEEAIEACKDWTNDTAESLKMAVDVKSGALKKSIKGRVKVKDLEPSVISFSFARYGAWLEKGAGRGAGGTKGSSWYNKEGNKKHTNPKSLNKMGNLRQPHQWIDNTIDDRMPVLADLIATHVTDAVIKFIAIK